MDTVCRVMDCLWKQFGPKEAGASVSRKSIEIMFRVLTGMIMSGQKFGIDDFWGMNNFCGIHQWTGKGTIPGRGRWVDPTEVIYEVAVKSGNISAQRSFLHWKHRPEILSPTSVARNEPALAIFVGREFEWQDQTVICTSFNERLKFLTVVPKVDEFHRIATNQRVPSLRIYWKNLETKELDEAGTIWWSTPRDLFNCSVCTG